MSKDSAAMQAAFKEAFSAQQIDDVRPLLAEAIKGVAKAAGLDSDVANNLVKRALLESQQKEMKEIGRLQDKKNKGTIDSDLKNQYQAKAKEFVNNITNPQFAVNLSENITLHQQLTNKIEGIDPKIANAIALELTGSHQKEIASIKKDEQALKDTQAGQERNAQNTANSKQFVETRLNEQSKTLQASLKKKTADLDKDLAARVYIHNTAKTKATEALGAGVDDALAHKIATAYKDDLIKMQKLLKQQEAATAKATNSKWNIMQTYHNWQANNSKKAFDALSNKIGAKLNEVKTQATNYNTFPDAKRDAEQLKDAEKMVAASKVFGKTMFPAAAIKQAIANDLKYAVAEKLKSVPTTNKADERPELAPSAAGQRVVETLQGTVSVVETNGRMAAPPRVASASPSPKPQRGG
jgi:hypothetical protein